MTTNLIDNTMNLVAMRVDGKTDTLVMRINFIPGMGGQLGREVARTRLKLMKEVEHTGHREKNMLVMDKRTSMRGNRADHNKNKELQTKVGP